MIHDSAYEIAGDDPRIVRLLRISLTKLAASPGGPLKEMAEGVLDGSVDLRQAAMSDAYGDELGAAFGGFMGYYDHLDPELRKEIVQRAEGQLDALLDGPPAR